MKALILGGSGFIGRAVAKRFVGQVIIYDIKNGQDVLDTNLLEEYVAACDVVFDCSGVLGTAETFNHIQKTVDVNIKGTINVLDACTKHDKPLVYISLTNEWLNPYTLTKQTANKFCMMYAKEYGTKVTVVKALNVYGQGQKWGAVKKYIPTFIMQALRKESITINGDGQQIVDAVYLDDVAECMVLVWELQKWGYEFDLGTGTPLTVNEIVDFIIKELGGEKVYLPYRQGEPKQAISLGNPGLCKQILNYYPTTRFEDGIKKTIDWYKEHGETVYTAHNE